MAYQDPQATVEPYDFDAEMQRLLYGGQDPAQQSAAATPAAAPADRSGASDTPGTGTPTAPTPARTAAATSSPLPPQPANATTASAYSNPNPGYNPDGTPENDQRGGGAGPSAGGGDTSTTPPPIDPSSMVTRRNAVLDYYRRYWGRDAADWEQKYWADQQNLSLSDIENTLRNAPEATANGGRAGGSGTQTFDRNTDFGAPGIIEAYFQSRGVTPRGTSPDYWRTKWNEWGKNDPAYFFQRLQQAEEFGGGGGATPTPPAPTPPAPTPPAQDPRVSDAIDKLLQRGQTLPSGDDPELRAQFNPTAEVMQRNAARTKANASERAFAQGQYGESATNVANSQIDQAVGLDQSQLMGELVKTELAARRQDVVNALTFAEGQQKLALTQYLGQLDAALRQQGLDNQDRQYYFGLNADIAQREALLQQYLYNLLLGGGQ